jgi:hypothetical protein
LPPFPFARTLTPSQAKEKAMTGFWKAWMSVWWWAMAAGGVVFLSAAAPGFDGALLAFYDLIDWPLDGTSHFTEATRPTAAISGALFLGFLLAMRLVMRAAEEVSPALSVQLWRGLTGAFGVWFLTDSAASILTGVPVNALSNTLVLAGYLAPVLASGVMRAGAARPASA